MLNARMMITIANLHTAAGIRCFCGQLMKGLLLAKNLHRGSAKTADKVRGMLLPRKIFYVYIFILVPRYLVIQVSGGMELVCRLCYAVAGKCMQ
jgi:hypothetical protein